MEHNRTSRKIRSWLILCECVFVWVKKPSGVFFNVFIDLSSQWNAVISQNFCIFIGSCYNYNTESGGCQVVSPHCLVAPGYVAPTEVTSPQHRSCVAPTSWLCRPNIKDSPIDLRERSTYKHDTAVRFIDRSKEKFVRLLGCNSSERLVKSNFTRTIDFI